MNDTKHRLSFCTVGICLLLAAVLSVLTPALAKEEKAPPRGEWEELIAAAKKEGVVSIYATAIGPAVVPLRTAFKTKYGIDLEVIQGRPPEIAARLKSERRAGLYLADVGHMGETTATMDVKPSGITQPLTNLIISPDIKNSRNWINNRLPFVDDGHHVFMFSAMAMPQGVANSQAVKETDIVSFLDFLSPKWKGHIVLSDPTISGTSTNVLAALYKTFGEEKAMAAFRKLAAQEVVLTRDQRLLLEWVARGKYVIGIGHDPGLLNEFKRNQAPVRILSLQEPRTVSGGPGNLIVFKNNPHPKAAQLYVNWLLSKEGLSIWSKAQGYSSTRVDVSQEWLDPATIPRTTDVFPDEEHLELRVKMRKLAAELFGQLMK